VPAPNQRYVKVTQRMCSAATVAGATIWLLNLGGVWGNWRSVALVLGALLALTPFNVLVNRVLLPRLGVPLAETLRTGVNALLGAAVCHFTHWPVAALLWLPFIALAYDHSNPRVGWSVLLGFALINDAVALLDGVPWLRVVVSTWLAVFYAYMSNLRLGVIRGMLGESDAQRSTLAKALATLKESEAKLSSLMDHTDDAIASLDGELRLVTMNPSFRALLTWATGAEPRPGDTPFADAPDHEAWPARLRRVLAGEPVNVDQVFRSGEEARTFEIALSPIYAAAGQVSGVTLFGRDVSARKRAERTAHDLQRQLRDTSRQAGMAEVSTAILHNVGNALNSVCVSVGLLADKCRESKVTNLPKVVELVRRQLGGATDPQQSQLVAYVELLSQHLVGEQRATLDELRGVAKNVEHIKQIISMQQGYAKLSGVAESVKLSELIDDAVALQAGSCARYGVTVERSGDMAQPLTIDRNRLLQILVNLISNARQALAESSQTDKRIVISVLDGDEGTVHLEVADNGVGIAADNLARIFRHGFTTKKDGHGFGLHASINAAMEMGGSMSVHSDGVGRGAVFSLLLPRTPPAARPGSSRSADRAASGSAPAPARPILSVC
jgi:PAS domain S-box-containing protein